MNVRRDHTADAAYIHIQEAPIASTVELEDGTVVDLANDGSLVGVEIFGVSRGWNADVVGSTYGLTPGETETLEALTLDASVAASRLATPGVQAAGSTHTQQSSGGARVLSHV